MARRRAARELALQGLHSWDQHGPDSGPHAAREVIADRGRDPEIAAYACALLETYWKHALDIDERIEGCSEHWRLARMAVVDRNVLRLAVTELLHFPDVPPKVVIDEAIEIAKRFSTERSGAFVNGILDRVLSEREETHGSG